MYPFKYIIHIYKIGMRVQYPIARMLSTSGESAVCAHAQALIRSGAGLRLCKLWATGIVKPRPHTMLKMKKKEIKEHIYLILLAWVATIIIQAFAT